MERPTRRFFIAALAGATVLALEQAVGMAHASKPSNQAPAYAQVLDPVEAIKKKEADMGSRPLKIADAKEIVQLGAEWASQRTDGVLNDPLLLASRTYVLTSGQRRIISPLDPELDPLKHPVIVEFYKNYQDYPYGEGFATVLLEFYNSENFGQSPSGSQQTWINLDKSNYPFGFATPHSPNRFQYSGTGPNPQGTPITPVVAFVSIKNHEDFHLVGQRNGMVGMDPEIIFYLQRNNKLGPEITSDQGGIGNFEVHPPVLSEKPELKDPWHLNEIITDHQRIWMEQDAGLPFWIAYQRQPIDHFNLRVLIEQSGLSLPALHYQYNNHLLREYYSSIALGAKRSKLDSGKIFTGSENIQILFDFAIPTLPWWKFPEWDQNIQNHFPGIVLPRAA